MLTHGSLFSGIEGFGLGAALAGIKTVWSCELEDYQTLIIKKNFGEKHEINRDIRTYKNPPFVDIISGGFPCQDISIAGKGVGIIGERSGLWSEMFRIVREVRPSYVLIENSPMLAVRGFEQVLCDLSEIGYDAEWQCLSGTDFGIQQNRERLYCIAYPFKPFIDTKGKRLHERAMYRDNKRRYRVTGFDFDTKKVYLVGYEIGDIREEGKKNLFNFTNKEWNEFRKQISQF